MSTTAVMELTDTQMLDYSIDSDYTMHATGHSSEWLPIEATMSDDNVLPATEYSEAIEIDMEHNEDEEMTEYEMTDGADYVDEGAVEIQDVDFAEPSQAASPLGASALGSPVLVDAASLQPPIDPPQALTSPVVHPEPFVFSAPTSDRPEHHSPSIETPAFSAISETSQQPHDSSLQQPEHIPGDRSDGAEPSRDFEHPTSPVRATVGDAPACPEPEPQAASAERQSEEGHLAVPNGETGEAGPPEEGVLQVEEPSLQAARPSDETAEVLVNGEVHESASNGDPHEISDGVYIDPPPAVLLSLSTSSRRVECCMFNQPHTASRSQSPNGHASSSSSPELALLLSQRPTLYYEPLSNVFEAFREEEAINSIPEFVDGELVLEAYDLDLRISEDNIHTGEVTIHELNILHDGIDMAGPLRLRLSAMPRFINRYHALRDQVAQLSLEAGLDNVAHPQADLIVPVDAVETVRAEELSSHAEESEITHLQAVEHPLSEQGEDHVTAEPVTADTEGAGPTLNDETDVEAEQSLQPTSSQAADVAQISDAHGAVQPSGEATVEYGTELSAEEAAEGLDADEPHRLPDAEEGGDYTDYAHANQDDEEDFGEELPELAGAAPSEAVDDQHENLADVYAEVSTATDGTGQANVESETDNRLETVNADVAEPPITNSRHIVDGEEAGAQDVADSSTETTATGRPPANDAARPDGEQLESFDEYDAEGDHQQEGDDQSDEGSEHLQDDLEEWGEYDDPEDDTVNVAEDTLSKTSSETLSTLSKRSREDEDDEEEDGDGRPPGSPDSKRARVE